MELITTFVSRDKLMEWEKFATEKQHSKMDEVCPSVKAHGIIISICLFVISLYFGVPDVDHCASRCFSVVGRSNTHLFIPIPLSP